MPDEKRIKDFEPATNLLIDDWFAVDSPSQGTRKMQASMFQEGLQTQITTNTENIALHSGQISVLQQGVGNLGDRVDVLDAAITTDAYSASSTYAVNDYCIYENVMYKCITAIETPEAFTPSHWQATSIEGELNELNSSLTNIQSILPQVGTATASVSLTAGQHTNVNVPITIPSGKSIRFVSVLYTPNAAYVFANINVVRNTSISVGLYNTATSSVSGNVTVQYLYY